MPKYQNRPYCNRKKNNQTIKQFTGSLFWDQKKFKENREGEKAPKIEANVLPKNRYFRILQAIPKTKHEIFQNQTQKTKSESSIKM